MIFSDIRIIVSLIVLTLNVLVFLGYFIVAKRRFGKIKTVGTLHIDDKRDNKTIVLFTLDTPIDELKEETCVLMKIDKAANLQEWNQ